MNTQPIRLLIVDDHALFRESIARMLATDNRLEVVGIAGSLDEAKDAMRVGPIDLVLLDYDLGRELGVDLLHAVQVTFPMTRVLMVTGGMSAVACRRAAAAGARGLVLKHSSPEHLVGAILTAADGGTWWNPKFADAQSDDTAVRIFFTDRQQRTLDSLLEGLSNKEIARNLQISEAAVKASLQELFRKVGVRSRSQLVRFALEKQLVTSD